MQEIRFMEKIIHWFMKKVVVKNRVIRSTDFFRPLVSRKVPYKTRKLVGILNNSGKQDDKPYLLIIFPSV